MRYDARLFPKISHELELYGAWDLVWGTKPVKIGRHDVMAYIRIYQCIYIYGFISVYTYIYTYIYIYIHIFIYINIYLGGGGVYIKEGGGFWQPQR